MTDHRGWVTGPPRALGHRRAARLPRAARTRSAPISPARSTAVRARQDDNLCFFNPLLVSQLHRSEARLTVCSSVKPMKEVP